MEHACKADPKLHKIALERAIGTGNAWMIDMIKAMNPKKLSPADIETLQSYLEEE